MNECFKTRKKLELSQRAFAILLGVSTASVSNWEQGRGAIPDMAKSLLFLLESDFLHKDRRVAIRLTQKACTKKYKKPEDIEELKLLVKRFIIRDVGKVICSAMLFKSNGQLITKK